MANLIRTVEATGQHSWTALTVVSGKDTPLTFSVRGGTFQDGSTEKTIAPDSSRMYSLPLVAQAPTDDSIVHHVTVYYDDEGQLTLLQNACLNLVCPVVRAIDWRIQTKGFGFLPKGSSASSAMRISFGSVDPQNMPLVSSLPVGAQTFEDPITVIYDSAAKICYWIQNSHSAANARRVVSRSIALTDVLVRYHPSSHMREIIEVEPSGRVTVYGVANSRTIQLPFNPVRVTYSSITATFKIIDSTGALYTVDSNFTQLSVDRSAFYVSMSSVFDAKIDRAGNLYVNGVKNSTLFFYQFGDDSSLVYGYDRTTPTTIQSYNLMTGAYSAKTAMQPENTLLFRAASAWSDFGGIPTLGPDTVISEGIVLAGISSNPYRSDVSTQVLTYFFQPVSNYAHMVMPDYSATLPQFDAPMGSEFSYTFKAVVTDPDVSVPITLPDGITWTATVRGIPTRTARNGDDVTIHVVGGDYSTAFFPISLGRSSGLVELIPDALPDPFEFASVHDQPENFWYKTEEIRITGINVRVPVTALVNRQTDYSRIKFWVNGVLTPMPVYIHNNDMLAIEVYHGQYQTMVDLTVGDRDSNFGVYTIDELPLPPLTNWCYIRAGQTMESELIENTSPTDLDLTITSDVGEFIQGGKTIKLLPGMSTRLVLTTEANVRHRVEFSTLIAQYTWDVWTDDTWLDALPAQKRAASMELTESDPIKFATFATGKWKTILDVPAGILLEVGGTDIEGDLDSRGVYADMQQIEIEVADLIISAFPRTQDHVIRLGDASLSWLCSFLQDPSYVIAPPAVKRFALRFIREFRHRVRDFSQRSRAIRAGAVKAFDRIFESDVAVGIKHFATAYADARISAIKSFLFPELEALMQPAPKRFDVASPRFVYVPKSAGDSSDPRHVLELIHVGNDPSRPQYRTSNTEQSDAYDGQYAPHPTRISLDSLPVWFVLPYQPSLVGSAAAQYQTYNIWGSGVDILPAQYQTYNFDRWVGIDTRRVSPVKWYSVETHPNWAHYSILNPYMFRIEVHIVFKPKAYMLESEYRRYLDYAVPQVDVVDANQYIQPATAQVYSEAIARHYNDPAQYDQSTSVQYAVTPPHAQVSVEQRYVTPYIPSQVLPDPKAVAQVIPFWATTAPDHVDTYTVHEIDREPEPVIVRPPVFEIVAPKKRAARPVVSLPLPARQFNVLDTEIEQTVTDPLKTGYFETEQLALHDAIQVWGHDPSIVRAIVRADGTWYWVRIIPCNSSCGAFACDARGYLAGG